MEKLRARGEIGLEKGNIQSEIGKGKKLDPTCPFLS